MQSPDIRIAIADDHKLVREGILTIINCFPYCTTVAAAENGKELIERLEELTEPPDIAILDISMPVLNGYDTIIELKKRYSNMKFLALSILDKEYSILRMIKNGANGYLNKSCSPNELYEAMISIYSDGYYYSNLASEKTFSVINNNKLSNQLTAKEIQFLKFCANEEYSFEKIAEMMYISYNTAQDYQKHIGKKLNIHSRTGLALFAVQTGLVPINIQ